jgi:hypothetical protein
MDEVIYADMSISMTVTPKECHLAFSGKRLENPVFALRMPRMPMRLRPAGNPTSLDTLGVDFGY